MKVAQILTRVIVVVVPPLLLASALFAAPKQPPPPKKPPIKWTPKAKDAGALDTGGDAGKPEAGPKETKLDAKVPGLGGETGAVEVKAITEDGAVKLLEFGQLGTSEIEGRSRWPAVSYFIRRMRAEFEAQKLPHRSFLPEMSASKGDPAVK
jgi:hypothetical protein